MKQARKTEARKAPTQERSRKMVEKILLGSKQLLADEGLEALTTSRIAAQAGISVGSLYQYFPNKLAILKALYSAWLDAVIEELNQLLNFEAMPVDDFWPFMRQALDRFYAPEHFRESDPERRVELELTKGMHLFKELKEIDDAHQWRVAEVIAAGLAKMFPDCSADKLKQVSLYAYYLHSTFDELIGEQNGDVDILLEAHKQAMLAVIKSLQAD